MRAEAAFLSNSEQAPSDSVHGIATAPAAKTESKTGHDLPKGADRFEERSKSSDGKSGEEKQKE